MPAASQPAADHTQAMPNGLGVRAIVRVRDRVTDRDRVSIRVINRIRIRVWV